MREAFGGLLGISPDGLEPLYYVATKRPPVWEERLHSFKALE